MISSKKTKKSILIFLIVITLFLIMPATMASENMAISENQELSIENTLDNIALDTTDIKTLSDDVSTVYVNATVESGDGSGSADNPARSIEDGLNLAKDSGTIYLNGKFSNEGNCNLTLDSKTAEITFIGVGNAVIDGNFTHTFATVKSGSYTFKNISFINHYKYGVEEFGGVFYNTEGTLIFEDCIFENNIISGVNRANGGVIDNSGKITFTNCIFKNNTATVSNSSGFRKNAADGGAISNVGTLYLYNSSFIENHAMRNGGAIRTQDHATTYIDGCEFISNVAEGHLSGGSYGGAIYTWDCGLELYRSTFKNNRIYDASGYGALGGALSLNRGIGQITISSCEFTNNTAAGISNADGQSIYFDSVDANVNYCSIDTSIFSISQTIDLNYNWWAASNINTLIENLPSSAAIKTFAELKILSDVKTIKIDEDVLVKIGLYWNGTENQNNINLIPLRHVDLQSIGGILLDDEGDLNGGSFETIFTPEIEDVLVTAIVDGVNVESGLQNEGSKFEIICDDLVEGESAVINIATKVNRTKFCLIEVDGIQYYSKIASGKGYATIPGLNSGKYDANISFYDSEFNKLYENITSITVKDKLNPQMTATITNDKTPIVNVKLDKASSGNISILLNGKESFAASIDNGAASIPLENLSDRTYSVEIRYSGDSSYGSQSIFTGLVIGEGKKSTTLEVAKSFTIPASDYSAGERGGYITASLKDSDNNTLSRKTIQMIVNGKIYNAITDENGVAKLKFNFTSAGTYHYVISFNGDNENLASAPVTTKLTVTKKATFITASKKTFKANAKTKTVSVTLKTSKNKLDGKTYLSKGKKITLKVNGKTFSAKTNAKGTAKIKIKLTKKGKFTATVKFAGDNTYKSSTKKIKIIIK